MGILEKFPRTEFPVLLFYLINIISGVAQYEVPGDCCCCYCELSHQGPSAIEEAHSIPAALGGGNSRDCCGPPVNSVNVPLKDSDDIPNKAEKQTPIVRCIVDRDTSDQSHPLISRPLLFLVFSSGPPEITGALRKTGESPSSVVSEWDDDYAKQHGMISCCGRTHPFLWQGV